MSKYIGEDIAAKILSYSVLPKHARVSKAFEKGSKRQEIEVSRLLSKVFPGWNWNTDIQITTLNIVAFKGDWDIFLFILNHNTIFKDKHRSRVHELLHAFNKWNILSNYCKKDQDEKLCSLSSDPVDLYYMYLTDHSQKKKMLKEYTTRIESDDREEIMYGIYNLTGYLHHEMRQDLIEMGYGNLIKRIENEILRPDYEANMLLIPHLEEYDPYNSRYTYMNLDTVDSLPYDELVNICSSAIITPYMMDRVKTLVKEGEYVDVDQIDSINPVILYFVPEIVGKFIP